MEEYNPHAPEYKRLKSALQAKNKEKTKLDNELAWYETVNIDNLESSIKGKEKQKKQQQNKANNTQRQIRGIQKKIQETETHMKAVLNPLYWISKKQKSYRKILNELKGQLNVKQDQKANHQAATAKTSKEINKINKEIKRYQCFDKKEVGDKSDLLCRKISSLEKKFKRVSELKNKIDIALQPVQKQIDDYESKIEDAKYNITRAESYNFELGMAANSYERKKIHQKCERYLGNGKPQKIINRQKALISRLESDLYKAKKRAVLIVEKAARNIKKIVIDGNNMCFEGDEFVGLKPLIKTTAKLQKKHEIIIIFDSKIRTQIQAGDREIRAKFDDNITVHVVATEQSADETILDIASIESSFYVLSNDRFGEFNEKDVVKNNRLIRHEIVDGKVIIHDLNVNVSYR